MQLDFHCKDAGSRPLLCEMMLCALIKSSMTLSSKFANVRKVFK